MILFSSWAKYLNHHQLIQVYETFSCTFLINSSIKSEIAYTIPYHYRPPLRRPHWIHRPSPAGIYVIKSNQIKSNQIKSNTFIREKTIYSF